MNEVPETPPSPEPAPASLATEAAQPTETPPTETPPAEAAPEFVPLAKEEITFGEDLTYDDAVVDSFLGLMNDQELTPAQRAQGLLDLQAQVAKAASEANSQAWDTLQGQWQETAKADPEFGGAKFQATMTGVGKLVAEYGTPELRQALDITGAGNHPEVIRFLGKLSSILTEGGPALGTPPSGAETSTAQKLFPSMN